jgi:ribokinase
MASADRVARFRATVRTTQTYAVLDVDRTIVNTTSWYHACMTPDLLLPAELVSQFSSLNDRTYGSTPSLGVARFRDETLALIAQGSAPLGKSAHGFEEAGRIIGSRLVPYDEPFDYLRLLQRRYGDRLRVLYLTAGYEPFIRGVVERLHQRQRIARVQYTVIGTSLDFDAGPPSVRDLCDGAVKAEIIRAILDAGAALALVADDNHHDLIPFADVEVSGGVGVRVAHQSAAAQNATWARFLRRHGAATRHHREVMHGAGTFSLADIDAVLRTYGPALDDLPRAPNGIGVGEVTGAAFTAAADSLCGALPTESMAAEFRAGLIRLVHEGPDGVRLRGDLYHLDAPPYLFADPRPVSERWAEQVDVARRCLHALERGRVLQRWGQLSRAERWLVLCVLDHLKNAVSQAVDTLVRKSVEMDEDRFTETIDRLAHRVHAAYWALLLGGRPDVDLSVDVDWDELLRQVQKCEVTRFPMRELDDPFVIAVSVLSLIEQMHGKPFWPAGIVDFVSGGLELGMAFRAISRAVCADRPDVGVAHLVYSSKHRLRSGAQPIGKTYTKLLCRVAPHQRDRIDGWLTTAQPVLLYDNNVATFATLAAAKSGLGEQHQSDVRAAVAAVYYDNVVRHLSGEPNEGLCDGWQDTLDYRPVADYVTAFATWGTSAKTRTLDRLYAATPVNRPHVTRSETPPGRAVFKVCRVHNLLDLDTVLAAGADIIGIHAVSPPEPDYGAGQRRHRPILAADGAPADLPLARYEVASIRQMVGTLPAGILPALVIERPYPPRDVLRIISSYGLDRRNAALQLQYRVDAAAIRSFRARLGTPLICAVGADQADFGAYFSFLDSVLDPGADLVLVDFSRHQPDLIGRPDAALPGAVDADVLAANLRPNRVPVLLADDGNPEVLAERARRMARAGVLIAGVDTQNSVEVPKSQQLYRLIADADRSTQALVRKSPDLLRPWTSMVTELAGERRSDGMITCVGDMMVDVFTDPDGGRRAHPGGKACNYAAMARVLGSPAATVGCVGADEEGRALLTALRSVGVDISGVRVDPRAATGADFFEHGAWRMERGANWHLTAEHVRAALDHLAAAANLSAVIVNQGVSAPAAEEAVRYAHARDVFLVLNLAPEAVEPERRIGSAYYPKADLIVVNQVEADVLLTQLGLSGGGAGQGHDHLSRRLLAATTPRGALVLTSGPRGATAVLTNGEPDLVRVPGRGAPHVDPEHGIGAGDAMLAAVTVELVDSGPGLTAAQLAAALDIGVSVATASLDYAGTLTGSLTAPDRFRELRRTSGTHAYPGNG